MTTPILDMEELAASQSQPHLTINAALRTLEAACNLSAISRTATPPGSPVDGDTYLIAPAATGAWSGHDEEVAVLVGGGWHFLAPHGGWVAYNQADNEFLYFDSSVSPGEWTGLFTRGIDHIEVTDNTTLNGTHNGAKLVIPDGDSPGITITVPDYSTTPLSLNHTTTIVNMSANPATIAIEGNDSPPDVIYYAPSGNSASRTLAQYGVCTLTKVAQTAWILTGVGLT